MKLCLDFSELTNKLMLASENILFLIEKCSYLLKCLKAWLVNLRIENYDLIDPNQG